ncbi:thiol:disulfide interchange protein DsbA/DsbL [Massilia sp. YMA4]|uniref:thiol:disulfide interchange protein DsbA/DsbL n=1 Tax=Massilia sp. YMA4 TaxID=1593482 RepID=UPI000DD0EF10|nr:thiol:disulfide interchange protein DsbA/DsbL [Massilia sp. YMA4]AXA92886.1 thiol:disulfide interchange protein DsbA/DsbL [Massilia sp. YMA4]
MQISKRNFLLGAGAIVSTAVLLNVASAPSEAARPYLVLDAPTPPPGPVEVIEFFWYSCPHCYHFEPALRDWVARQGDSIVFRRVPVGMRAQQLPQQRMFYVMQALEMGEPANQRLFRQIHEGGQALDTEVALAGFALDGGIAPERFHAAWRSTAVQRQVDAATRLHTQMKVASVPAVVIGGRYLTSPAMLSATMPMWGQTAAMGHAATIRTMDTLLARARQDSATQ